MHASFMANIGNVSKETSGNMLRDGMERLKKKIIIKKKSLRYHPELD